MYSHSKDHRYELYIFVTSQRHDKLKRLLFFFFFFFDQQVSFRFFSEKLFLRYFFSHFFFINLKFKFFSHYPHKTLLILKNPKIQPELLRIIRKNLIELHCIHSVWRVQGHVQIQRIQLLFTILYHLRFHKFISLLQPYPLWNQSPTS